MCQVGHVFFYLPHFQMLRHTPCPYTYSPGLKITENVFPAHEKSFLYFVLSDCIKNCRNPFEYTTSKTVIVTSARLTQKHDFEKQHKSRVNLNYQVNH